MSSSLSSSDSTSYSSYNNYGSQERCLFPFIFRCFLYCSMLWIARSYYPLSLTCLLANGFPYWDFSHPSYTVTTLALLICVPILFSILAWSTLPLSIILCVIKSLKGCFKCLMSQPRINSLMLSRNHYPGNGSHSYGPRLVSPMGAPSCGGV